MKKFFRSPIALTLVMIVTFTWFSYLWWQDQKTHMVSEFANSRREVQTLPESNKLPAPPVAPGDGAAAASLSQ